MSKPSENYSSTLRLYSPFLRVKVTLSPILHPEFFNKSPRTNRLRLSIRQSNTFPSAFILMLYGQIIWVGTAIYLSLIELGVIVLENSNPLADNLSYRKNAVYNTSIAKILVICFTGFFFH